MVGDAAGETAAPRVRFICSNDGIGRLDWLKISCRKACGFESHFEHHMLKLGNHWWLINANELVRFQLLALLPKYVGLSNHTARASLPSDNRVRVILHPWHAELSVRREDAVVQVWWQTYLRNLGLPLDDQKMGSWAHQLKWSCRVLHMDSREEIWKGEQIVTCVWLTLISQRTYHCR